jgi:hypothetical protein
MNFKSDAQRKAVFTSLFSKGSNRFALYIKDNHIRSTVYPQVNVKIKPRKSLAKELISNMDEEDERNLADLRSVRIGKLYGDANGIYDFVTKDIDVSSRLHPLDAKEVMKHELLHHIDDEVTPEKYAVDPGYFESFASDMEARDLNTYFVDREEERKLDKNYVTPEWAKKDLDSINKSLERYESADALKDLSTLTYDDILKCSGEKDAQCP